LITSSRSGFSDVFRDRIIFPILDARSRVIAFGGRTHVNDSQGPKYINSLESVLYSKRNHLFGLSLAKDDIIKQQAVIVVEGYLDMIIPFMEGASNIVASLGTALTEEQIRLIKRYCSKVILAYDSDKAGQSASLRSLDLLIEQGIETKVLKLPEGYDPDSLVREKGKDFFLELVNEAGDFFDYKLSVLNYLYRKESIDGKTKIAQEMLLTIDRLPSEIQKYEYIRKLSSSLNVKEEIMIAEFQKKVSAKNNNQRKRFSGPESPQISQAIAREPLPVTEKVILKFILTNPKAFSLVKKNLKPEYFSTHFSRKVISLFFDKYAEDGEFSPSKFISAESDKEISGFLSRILIDDDIPLDKNIFKDSLLKLKEKRNDHFKSLLREEIRDAESRGDKKKVKELIAEHGKFNRGVRNA
ncbi:MAG: toprim domain-containing protein, partial [Candidatus Omnitrophica bacterium]|nr:toprim domain-containing protein [Candidatus Omnitrophota bacterium]